MFPPSRAHRRTWSSGGGENLDWQLDSAANQAEQLRDQQVTSSAAYNDQLGIYVQEKAEQIDRQSNLAAALTSEKAQLQAIRQSPPWTAGKKAHVQWEQQVARRTTRIAQVMRRLNRVGEIEEAAGVYAETKIEELAERQLRFDHPELA